MERVGAWQACTTERRLLDIETVHYFGDIEDTQCPDARHVDIEELTRAVQIHAKLVDALGAETQRAAQGANRPDVRHQKQGMRRIERGRFPNIALGQPVKSDS
jgi:hypothetical protein